MIKIDATGLDEVKNWLSRRNQERQIPFALSLALNRTLFDLRQPSAQQIQRAFDRPTPLIAKATQVVKTTKTNLAGSIGFSRRRTMALWPQEVGGNRPQKKFERDLGLPAGWFAVPTKNMPLNQYGNPQAAMNGRILAAKQSKARGIYFINPGTRSRQSPGIYQLVSKTKIIKLYHYVNKVAYRPIFHWEQTLEAQARQILPQRAKEAVLYALETTRP